MLSGSYRGIIVLNEDWYFRKLTSLSYLFPSIEPATGLAQSPSFVQLHDTRERFQTERFNLGEKYSWVEPPSLLVCHTSHMPKSDKVKAYSKFLTESIQLCKY